MSTVWGGARPSSFGNSVVEAVKDAHAEAEIQIAKVLARRSPVLSGAFKADWEQHVVRVGSYFTRFENHKEYALKLEGGASNINAPYSRAWPKAPDGVARVTVIEVSYDIQKRGLIVNARFN